MLSARPLARTGVPRVARLGRLPGRPQRRFQSSSSTASSNVSAGSSSLGAGIVGGVAGAAVLYVAQSFTPAGQMESKINKAAREANKKYQAAAKKLQEATPSADETVDAIKQFAYSYVAWIPGGRAYVDTAFKDFDTVRENHRDEADQIVRDAYKQLQDVAKSGLSLETLSRAWDVLADITAKVADLATDAAADVLDNHPQLKEKLGGNIDQLKQLGDQYGPEAKKQVDETWKQIKGVMAGGFSVASLDKARKLIDDKVQQLKKLGDEAWNKGLEEAKPLLDKNPKIKELLEKNTDALKQGDAKAVFDKVRTAAESGDLGGLEEYVSSATEKAKSVASKASGGGLEQYLKMIPQGEEIIPKLKQLSQVAEKHKEEGEKLLKETMDEVKQVLAKRSKQAQDLADKAKKEAK